MLRYFWDNIDDNINVKDILEKLQIFAFKI